MKPRPMFVTRTRIPVWKNLRSRPRKDRPSRTPEGRDIMAIHASERDGDLVQNLLDGVLLAPSRRAAVEGSSRDREDPMGQDGDGDTLDVVRRGIRPSRHERARLHRAI